MKKLIMLVILLFGCSNIDQDPPATTHNEITFDDASTGADSMYCPPGSLECGPYCATIGNVCCASSGHPEISCLEGETCNPDGTCNINDASQSMLLQ